MHNIRLGCRCFVCSLSQTLVPIAAAETEDCLQRRQNCGIRNATSTQETEFGLQKSRYDFMIFPAVRFSVTAKAEAEEEV